MSGGHGHGNKIPKQLVWAVYAIIFAAVVEFFPQNNINIDLSPKSELIKNSDLDPNDYEVVKVVDGDTIDVISGDKKYRVRLIGVDTPETVDPRSKVECFGKEASNYTTDLVYKETVHLEMDSSQGQVDKYGRLLAYVYLLNGEMLNKKLISDGYGQEYTYQAPYRYQKEFRDLEAFAKREGRGLWQENACSDMK